MRYCNQGRFRQQADFLCRQLLQDGDLPFGGVLSEQIIAQALTAVGAFWQDRIYSPLITLWVFLGQVLSQDHSCRAAVARLISHRVSRGQRPCSAETGAYCQARKRLPEKFFSEVARQTGRALDANAAKHEIGHQFGLQNNKNALSDAMRNAVDKEKAEHFLRDQQPVRFNPGDLERLIQGINSWIGGG